MQWLTMTAYALPEFFGLGLALVLLMSNARQGPARKLGLIGISLMLGAVLIGFGLSILQTLWIQNGPDTMRGMFQALTAARVLLNVISMAGLVTVVWGLCRATRENAGH
jgi:disulfide bond formation protein DsbB